EEEFLFKSCDRRIKSSRTMVLAGKFCPNDWSGITRARKKLIPKPFNELNKNSFLKYIIICALLDPQSPSQLQ
uniref:hypothetical protein n=1 Tax=Flavobacterium sp. TaxID=239 RepID=UPI0040495AE9